MDKKYTLLVICAVGYATSTMIKRTINDHFSSEGVTNWEIECIGYNMLGGRADNADLIVTSLDLKQEEYKAPVINGVALISGIGKAAVLDKIMEEVRKIEANKA